MPHSEACQTFNDQLKAFLLKILQSCREDASKLSLAEYRYPETVIKQGHGEPMTHKTQGCKSPQLNTSKPNQQDTGETHIP